MNNETSPEQRIAFRNWFREKLRALDDGDFYQKRTGHFLTREFSLFCSEQGTRLTRRVSAATCATRAPSFPLRSAVAIWRRCCA